MAVTIVVAMQEIPLPEGITAVDQQEWTIPAQGGYGVELIPLRTKWNIVNLFSADRSLITEFAGNLVTRGLIRNHSAIRQLSSEDRWPV